MTWNNIIYHCCRIMDELREKTEKMMLQLKTEQCKQAIKEIIDECFDLILSQQVPEGEVIKKLEEALKLAKGVCE